MERAPASIRRNPRGSNLTMLDLPGLGHGVGLRSPHFPLVIDGSARADWFEVISENYMIPGGRPLKILEKARELAPIVLHGVSMNLGGSDPLREDYLDELDSLIRCFEPAWVSDHLCWVAIDGRFAHDLLPLPYTEETLMHVADRICRVQDRLGRRILVENVSSYLTYAHSTMPEWTFLSAIAEAGRLRNPARRKQCLCQRGESRIRSARISARCAGRSRWPVPSRGSLRRRHALGRYSRPSGFAGGLGTVSRRSAALRPRFDLDRTGRQHPTLRAN